MKPVAFLETSEISLNNFSILYFRNFEFEDLLLRLDDNGSHTGSKTGKDLLLLPSFESPNPYK
jgi:hypothetical protein